MDTNLTAHYLAIETERARLPERAARGRLVEEAIATRSTHTGTLTVRRRVGAVLSSVTRRRLFDVRQVMTSVHPALPRARS